MNYERGLIAISIFICIFFMISCVSAADDVASDENVTLNVDDGQTISQDDGSCDEPLEASDNKDVLSETIIYFDASANTGGDGSQARPYKYFDAEKIPFGATAYFMPGEYSIDSTMSISSSLNYKTTFIGQSSQNTIFKSSNSIMGFKIRDNANFIIKDITLDGVRINNNGNLEATNVVFKNTNSRYSTIYSLSTNIVPTLKLTNCRFQDNYASDLGGSISFYTGQIDIVDCVFQNSKSGAFGGAIEIREGILNILNSKFYSTEAQHAGAIYGLDTTIMIMGSTFDNSKSEIFGGVIACDYSQLIVDGCNFTNSQSLTDGGGAIYSVNGESQILNSLFNNDSSHFGGAICNLENNMVIMSCGFTDTYAQYYGGAIYNMYSNVNMTGSRITRSGAGTGGGAILTRFAHSFNIMGNTFTSTTADYGAIVLYDGDDDVIHMSDDNVYNGYPAGFEKMEYANFYSYHSSSSVPVLNFISQDPAGTPPSSYDSRDYGYITPVKDQASGGNCWVFGGLATLEACLKKATGIEFDFSEENVKNIMAEYSMFGWNGGVNNGGTDEMVWAYLASWFGPIYDEYDVYDEYSTLSVLYNPALHIQNILTFTDYRNGGIDITSIKKAIMDYGAVTMTTSWTSVETHCMSIVGWDDNFNGYDYFGSYARGAWIVKNSYGPEWGQNGYLYISFDRTIYDLYTFVFSSVDKGYSDIYQYDYGGLTNYWGSFDYKNRFTSRSNDILSAVSTYFEKATEYTIKIYLNGTLIRTQTGNGMAGYNVIPLDEGVQLSVGDVFEIAFHCPNSKVPVCKATYNNKETFDKNLSFYSYDGGQHWQDIYMNEARVACIKAFTMPTSIRDIQISIKPFQYAEINTPISIAVTLPEDIEGLVTFTIDGVNYYAQAKDGRACLEVSFDRLGTKDLAAQFISNLEKSNVVSFSFEVLNDMPSMIEIIAPDVTKYYGGSQKYSAEIYDNGLPLRGKTITVEVDGKTYTATTDSYGKVTLDLVLNPGVYTVRTFCDSKMFSSKFTVKSTIGATDFSGEYKNTYVNATFLDAQGNLLQSGEATFRVNGKNETGTINNGYASAKLDIDAGNYTVYIINPSTGEQVAKKLLIEKTNPKFYVDLQQDGYIVSIKADLPFNSTGYVTLACEDRNAFSPINNTVDVENRGYTILNINNLDVGTHKITAYYEGDDNYKSAFFEENITVEETDIVITADDYEYYYGGSNDDYYVTVYNNGRPVNRPVGITIDGWTDLVSDSYGNPHTNIKVKRPGVYEAVISYGGVSTTRIITVKATIIANSTFTYDYLSSKVSANFLDTNGNALKNRVVTITVDDVDYYVTTDSDGFITKDIPLGAGEYDMVISTPVSNEEFNAKLIINKITPKLNYTLKNNIDSYGFASLLTPLATGGSMVYTFEGKDYTIGYSGGFADFIMHTTRAGNHNLVVKFTGDDNLNPVSESYTLNLENKADLMSANDITTGYGQYNSIAVTLKYANGQPKAYSTVTVSVNGRTAYLTTNANGVAYYVVDLDAGTYSIAFSSNNNGHKNVRATVNKVTPTLKASKKTYKLKVKTKKFKATLNLPKKKLNHYKLTLKVKGKTYKAFTNAKGQATFKINKLKKKGTFKATIKFAGDRNLNKVTKTVKIKVK